MIIVSIDSVSGTLSNCFIITQCSCSMFNVQCIHCVFCDYYWFWNVEKKINLSKTCKLWQTGIWWMITFITKTAGSQIWFRKCWCTMIPTVTHKELQLSTNCKRNSVSSWLKPNNPNTTKIFLIQQMNTSTRTQNFREKKQIRQPAPIQCWFLVSNLYELLWERAY